MTRPRSCGSTESWTLAFAVVNAVSAHNPTGTRNAPNSHTFGAIAASAENTVNPASAASSSRSDGDLRRAASSAAASDPTAITDEMMP